MNLRWKAAVVLCVVLYASGAIGEDEGAPPKTWTFPQETNTAWYLGNADAAWAISKTTGRVIGGWNVRKRERYLVALEGRYHLEDRKSLVTGRETEDRAVSAQFMAAGQRIELTCSNPRTPDLVIGKRYWIRDNKLYHRVSFITKSPDLQFITFNVQAAFERAYRDTGYYMGGGDGGWPLIPAPKISSWQKVTAHRNTTKGMVLHQPEKGYGFAHIRTRLDEQFVWPWFTGAIASYCEKENILHYTPDGWDMSLGTSRLSRTQETSYEEYVSVFEGDWQRFLTHEYPGLPEVQAAYQEIPPTPAWVADVVVDTSSDLERLQRILDVTDEGYVTVLVDFGGNWADYYVDHGMPQSGEGGSITAEELRDFIRRIKALSPRVKVGIYMWQLSTCEGTRIFTKHPEWFRKTNKDGEQLSTFPGVATNYAQLLSIPECYNELLSQFDLVLGYLGTDFIYLDDPKAINPIDWSSGEFTRDDLSFKFFLDIKRIAAKHGPDKMVFFNNMCNPYADINYIEGRGELNAKYWRYFAGNVVIAETNLCMLPDARIVLLYYNTPYEREYVNRVLAMGWIPELAYGDVGARRAFIQAAYEVGNGVVAPVRYAPDWKRNRETQVESYAIRRNGDKGYLLSFISHADTDVTVPVTLEMDSFDLDRTGRIFVWEYAVEDACEFKGALPERLVRRAYKESGWQMDRVTRRKLAYAGPWCERLTVEVAMQPLLLHQLYVTSQSSAVYSENSLPGNFLFGRKPKVSLTERSDWRRGSVEVDVDSARDQSEIILALPLSEHRVDRVLLDGRAVEPALVWEGTDVFPVVAVDKGRHTLALAFSAAAPAGEPMPVKELRAGESLTGIRMALPGVEKALLTIEKDGRVLFNRMAVQSDGAFTLPLASARAEGGEYTVTVRAALDAKGQVRRTTPASARVDLAVATMDIGARSPASPMMPGKREITEINRDIRGLRVLRSAVLTTETPQGDVQPNLEALMARVSPDELLLEAGTTRKIGGRGAAFAGLEITNLRKVTLKLSNTFHDAFHIRGKGFHIPQKRNTNNFAGIVVDYHAPAGYVKRVRLATGVMDPQCSSVAPDYGKPGTSDEAHNLGAELIEKPETTFSLDLQRYAPPEWDGQVWLSVGSDWVASDRRLTLRVLAANDAVAGDFLVGADPRAYKAAYNKPKTLLVPRSPGGILIDGPSNEEWWRGAAETEQFFLSGGKGVPKANTMAKILYDDVCLYVAFVCSEPSRRKPLIQGGAVWDDDEVEVWIDAKGDAKTFRQVIVNAANEKAEFSEAGPTRIGTKSGVHVDEGVGWMVEMAIPFEGLGVTPPKPGDRWRLSLCRYRPEGKDFNTELIVWAPLQHDGFSPKDLANFGTLIFR